MPSGLSRLMMDFKTLCDQCAAHGVQSVVAGLHLREDIEALARACFARAKEEQEQGEQVKAQRLFDASQYLNYLIMPYD